MLILEIILHIMEKMLERSKADGQFDIEKNIDVSHWNIYIVRTISTNKNNKEADC